MGSTCQIGTPETAIKSHAHSSHALSCRAYKLMKAVPQVSHALPASVCGVTDCRASGTAPA